MFTTIVILPLFTVFLLTYTARSLGAFWVARVAVLNMWVVALYVVYHLVKWVEYGDTQYIIFTNWLVSNNILINYGLIEDGLSLIMLGAITLVSASVHLFAAEYMEADPHLSRFMIYLTLFTFFIIALVTADNYLQLFLAWEGVGFLSYLLINFWYLRVQANKSAIKAMLVNRVGDFGLFLAIVAMLTYFKTCTFTEIFTLIGSLGEDNLFYNSLLIGNKNISIVLIIALCIFIGAVGKSAQVGLHLWLPDAMEGPTPVSALIHAATMVTAGIFVTIRSASIFEYAESISFLIMVFGSLTAVFSAIMACFQNDIKKTIAYSTCSQLGYMFVGCGVSFYSLSLFHLFNHAFFKALCFVSAGASIHTVAGEQDVSEIGDEEEDLFQSDVFSLASSALAGTLFLSGYFSKDYIIDMAGVDTVLGNFLYLLCFVTVAITAIYTMGDDDDSDEEYDFDSFTLMIRNDLYNTSEEFWEGQKQFYVDSQECGVLSTAATGILLSLSSGVGLVFFDYLVGVGSNFFYGSTFIQNGVPIISENAVLLETVILSFAVSFIVGLVAADSWNVNNSFFRLGVIKLYIDKFINFISLIALKIYYISFIVIDKGLLEIYGPFGSTAVTENLVQLSTRRLPNFIYEFICFSLIGIIILLFIIEIVGLSLF